MKLLSIFMLLLCGSYFISAQTDSMPKIVNNNLYVEASSLLIINAISVNYERKLLSNGSDKIHLYGRVGLGYVLIPTLILCDGESAPGGLAGVTMLTGKGNSHFELNGGIFSGNFKSHHNDSGLFDSCSDSGATVLPDIAVGYRYQKPGEGFIFRAKIGTLGLGIAFGHAF